MHHANRKDKMFKITRLKCETGEMFKVYGSNRKGTLAVKIREIQMCSRKSVQNILHKNKC